MLEMVAKKKLQLKKINHLKCTAGQTAVGGDRGALGGAEGSVPGRSRTRAWFTAESRDSFYGVCFKLTNTREISTPCI